MATNMTIQAKVPAEDVALALALLTPFTQAYGGVLPLFVPQQNETTGETNLALPPWIEILISAMRKKYGDIYYSFPVNLLLNEILNYNKQHNVTAAEMDNFRLAVNKMMLKPDENIH